MSTTITVRSASTDVDHSGARYEDAIVQAMIDKDAGGDSPGKLNVTTPPKLGIWNTVVNGDADSTWIFEPFEGEQVLRLLGLPLTAMQAYKLVELGIS